MSLRDQLVAKGVASRKDAQRVNRSLKEERKQAQGAQKRKRALAREAQAAKEAAQAEQMRLRGELRKAQALSERLLQQRLQVYQLIRTNEVRSRGPIRFYHPDITRRLLLPMAVHERAANMLRRGVAAIVAFDHGGQVEYRIVGVQAAERIREILPELVLFLVTADAPPDPSEDFLSPDWDVSLRPHRVMDSAPADGSGV
ncbi:MAG: DUF2058 family protein [Deltaproteobacteria bacterium]|nr:DUF2058 family protein [Deltaproteobacteria bacterium]